MLSRIAIPVVLALAALLAYANSFSGVFLFDDVVRIVEEPRIRSLTPLSALLGGERPVVDFSLAVNYAIGWLNPSGYHLFNLIVHILAGWALFGVVRRTMLLATSGADTMSIPLSPPLVRGEAIPSADSIGGQRSAAITNLSAPSRSRLCFCPSLIALGVALIFLVHPLQTQSVTYIIQRGESLMGLFYLLTMYCAIRAIEGSLCWLWSLFAVAACALGMGTKGVMITAPLMVMIYDWVFLAPRNDSRSWFATIRSRVPLYVGLCATWVVLWWVGIAGEVLGGGSNTSHVGFSYHGHSAWEYALTQPGVIVQYMRLAFWPAGQVLDYDRPIAEGFARIVLPGLVTLILLGATVWLLKQRHWLGFLGAWFFLILAPTSSIVPIKDIMFEHRMYLPLAAVISAIVVPLGVWIMSRTGSSNGATAASAGQSRAAIGFAALVVLLGAPLAYATHLRNRVYHSELTMWQDVVAKRPGNSRGYVGLGVEYIEAREPANAIIALRKALELKNAYADAHFNLAIALSMNGNNLEAASEYFETYRLNPARVDALIHAAEACMSGGAAERAILILRQGLERWPENTELHYQLGNALVDSGDSEQARTSFETALRLDPSHARASVNLGNLSLSSGDFDGAQRLYERALVADTNYMAARINLGRALLAQQRWETALAEFRKVPKGDALEVEALHGSGVALARMNRRDEAAEDFNAALKLRPEHVGVAAELKRLNTGGP